MSGYRRKALAILTIDIRIQKRSIGYTDSIWLKIYVLATSGYRSTVAVFREKIEASAACVS